MGLVPEIREALREQGFDYPSKIQGYAIPSITKEPFKNLIAQSHNGSGKTLAFCISTLMRVDKSNPGLQGLILVHSRELATQVFEVIQSINVHYGLNVTMIKTEDKKPAIGQITICMLSKAMKLKKFKKMSFEHLKIAVVDEADFFFMTENDRADTKKLYQLINEEKPDCQKCFFSATYPDDVMDFIKEMVPENTIKIELPKEKLTLKGIKQYYHVTKRGDGEDKFFNSKLRVLKELYEAIDANQVIVFVNTRHYVDVIYKYLTDEGFTVHKIMGGMDMAERDQVMKQFRLKQFNFLIATDLLARGIDIPGMNMVLNFDVPYRKDKDGFFQAQKAEYLHRIGRTGRFDTKGVACTLIGTENYDNEKAVMDEIKDE